MNAKDQTLGNSNQRDLKGFKTTFSVKRPIAEVFGKYRLDWIFVKSYLRDPFEAHGPYRFAPHFGETLEEIAVHPVKLDIFRPVIREASGIVSLICSAASSTVLFDGAMLRGIL